MSQYFCRSCALTMGYIQYVDPAADFTGSVGSYQFEKFMKHTTSPATGSGIVSVFDSADYSTYAGYIIDTANSGSVEIDGQGRINIIWLANSPTGDTYFGNSVSQSVDAVKLVLHSDPVKIHPFPTGSSGFRRLVCNCGNPIVV